MLPSTPSKPRAVVAVERAWFRAGTEQLWHEVWHRDDLSLIARCGYERSWARSQQKRALTVPEPRCKRCVPRTPAGHSAPPESR